MTKYEVFLYDVWENECGAYVNETYSTGIIIYTDTSKSSLCKKLKLDDPYKLDVFIQDDVIYIDYEGKPYCELHEDWRD